MTTPRLHPDTIEQVRQAADIVDVVSEHVVLRKQGRNFVGCCPFHDEKTPSFSVSPEKQFYYCFGCGAGGNAIKFLMEIGQRSFGEVVLDLAQRHQVPIQTLAKDQEQQLTRQFSLREQLFEVLAIAATIMNRLCVSLKVKPPLPMPVNSVVSAIKRYKPFSWAMPRGGGAPSMIIWFNRRALPSI